jgi:hypothetical protein
MSFLGVLIYLTFQEGGEVYIIAGFSGCIVLFSMLLPFYILRRKVEITQNTISFKFLFHTKTILRCDIKKIRFFYVKSHGHSGQYSHNKILFDLQNGSYIYSGEFSKQVIEGMKIKEVGLSTYKRFRKTKKL